jgi:hypothetical protein
MTRKIYDRYIHEYTDSHGITRYAVAEWDQERGQYTRPTSKRTYKLSGCYAEFSRTVSYFGGWLTRRQALREARYLYGSNEERD